MDDIGGLIFYVILGVIALIGSTQGKRKKKIIPPGRPQQRPVSTVRRPSSTAGPTSAGQANKPQNAPPVVKPQYAREKPAPGSIFGELLAGSFSDEGSTDRSIARDFANEGSGVETMAAAFADEGSVSDTMAAAFATEGSSAISETQMMGFDNNEIHENEIGDSPVFDYDASPADEIYSEGFDLKRAIIYSALLNRKEYSF